MAKVRAGKGRWPLAVGHLAVSSLASIRIATGEEANHMRSNFMRFLAVTAVALVAASSAACSSSTPSGSSSTPSGSSSTPSASPFAGKTPAQVLAMAKAAALAKGSVRIIGDDNNAPWGTAHWVVDAGTPQGKEIAAGSVNCTFLQTSAQMAYLRGDAPCLELNLQFPQHEATKYAGQWIAVPSSSSKYWSLVSGEDYSSIITGTIPSAPLRFTKPTTIDGKSVIGISGGLGQGAPSSAGTNVWYIPTAAPYLPIAWVIQRTQSNGKAWTTSGHMSNYGESVVVTAPAHSIPISSIPGTS